MTGKILENKRIIAGGSLHTMLIETDAVALPGQFIHIKCGEGHFLRRPISVFDSNGKTLRICYDVRGGGTEYLSQLGEGAALDFLSPVGRGFTYKPGTRAVLVGGGIGIYPLYMIGKRYGTKAAALLGFRTASAVNCTELFSANGNKVTVSTDDGSCGYNGFVTSLLEDELKNGGCGMIYACGPLVMLRKTAELAEKYGVLCEVSLEERMGCGTGACCGCAVAVKTETGKTYKRVCADGPVFNAGEVVWSE